MDFEIVVGVPGRFGTGVVTVLGTVVAPKGGTVVATGVAGIGLGFTIVVPTSAPFF